MGNTQIMNHVIDLLSEPLDRVFDLLQESVEEFKHNYGDSPVLVTIPRVVVDQTRCIRYLLSK